MLTYTWEIILADSSVNIWKWYPSLRTPDLAVAEVCVIPDWDMQVFYSWIIVNFWLMEKMLRKHCHFVRKASKPPDSLVWNNFENLSYTVSGGVWETHGRPAMPECAFPKAHTSFPQVLVSVIFKPQALHSGAFGRPHSGWSHRQEWRLAILSAQNYACLMHSFFSCDLLS